MPNTPVTWRDEFQVNVVTDGGQSDPKIIRLANGNILVVWTTSSTIAPADANPSSLIGRIFDPLGNPVSGEFRINTDSTGNNEQDVDLVPLPGGGFMAVYEDDESAVSSGYGIRVEVYDANGAPTGGALVENDPDNNAPNWFDPQVAAASATNSLIVYEEQEAGGGYRIIGRIFDPTTNTVGAVVDLINFPGNNTNPDVTALSNGNYAIVSQTFQTGGAGDEITLRIINGSGGNVLGVTTIGGTGSATNSNSGPSITALTGGGFVIAWTQYDGTDTDVFFQVFNNAGGSVSAQTSIAGGALTDNNNEAVVIPLTDGGFAVIFDDDEVGQLMVQRFNSTGGQVGSEFLISTGSSITQPSATILDDGRFAVTFVRQNGEIGMEILDVRDTPNSTGVYTPDQWVVGTIGNDVFTPSGNAEITHGWDGDDVITESGGTRAYYGDAGNDTINVTSAINSDLHDGGTGSDTISWLGAAVTGATYDLAAGTATAAGGGSTEVMVNFENLRGTNNRDIVIGTNFANILEGNGGDDELYGNNGADELYGGNGNDYMSGGNDNDYMSGGGQNDVFFGGGGVDTMIGGAGNDEYYVGATDLNDVIVEYAGEGNDRIFASVSYSLPSLSEIETLGTDNNSGSASINLTGSDQANIIIGNNGVNILDGRGGNDILYGLGGTDYFAFSTAPNNASNVDTIADFTSVDDLIFLDDAIFSALSGGTLSAAAFGQGAGLVAATTAAQRILHDTTTGDLYYDADGAGGVAAVRFATIGAGTPIFNYDFFVY